MKNVKVQTNSLRNKLINNTHQFIRQEQMLRQHKFKGNYKGIGDYGRGAAINNYHSETYHKNKPYYQYSESQNYKSSQQQGQNDPNINNSYLLNKSFSFRKDNYTQSDDGEYKSCNQNQTLWEGDSLWGKNEDTCKPTTYHSITNTNNNFNIHANQFANIQDIMTRRNKMGTSQNTANSPEFKKTGKISIDNTVKKISNNQINGSGGKPIQLVETSTKGINRQNSFQSFSSKRKVQKRSSSASNSFANKIKPKAESITKHNPNKNARDNKNAVQNKNNVYLNFINKINESYYQDYKEQENLNQIYIVKRKMKDIHSFSYKQLRNNQMNQLKLKHGSSVPAKYPQPIVQISQFDVNGNGGFQRPLNPEQTILNKPKSMQLQKPTITELKQIKKMKPKYQLKYYFESLFSDQDLQEQARWIIDKEWMMSQYTDKFKYAESVGMHTGINGPFARVKNQPKRLRNSPKVLLQIDSLSNMQQVKSNLQVIEDQSQVRPRELSSSNFRHRQEVIQKLKQIQKSNSNILCELFRVCKKDKDIVKQNSSSSPKHYQNILSQI